MGLDCGPGGLGLGRGALGFVFEFEPRFEAEFYLIIASFLATALPSPPPRGLQVECVLQPLAATPSPPGLQVQGPLPQNLFGDPELQNVKGNTSN